MRQIVASKRTYTLIPTKGMMDFWPNSAYWTVHTEIKLRKVSGIDVKNKKAKAGENNWKIIRAWMKKYMS